MSDFYSSYLTISYHPESAVLQAHWRRSVMPFELQQGYAALLNAAVAHDCRYWLLDLRDRMRLPPSQLFWITEEFYPQLLPRLGQTTYLAFLTDTHQLAGVPAGSALPLVCPDEKPYCAERFGEEKTALAWLRKCQQEVVSR